MRLHDSERSGVSAMLSRRSLQATLSVFAVMAALSVSSLLNAAPADAAGPALTLELGRSGDGLRRGSERHVLLRGDELR